MKESSFNQNVVVKGARENNLKDISLSIPRDALVVFTGVSGSGKSSLAFGTIYAEAQRRYLESVSPYARRLFNQMEVPDVDSIEGLPPAVALQQQRGAANTRSSVGSITTLSNLLRMLYSRAGDYPKGQEIIYAEGFSPNSPAGACSQCHGLGRLYDVTEKTMVPDDSLSIKERAIAAWPAAWHGQNLRDMLVTLGFDINLPWKKLPKKDRDWILYTDETPSVPVYAGFSAKEVKWALKKKMEPSYVGNFTGVRKYVLTTFATTTSALMKKRVAKYMVNTICPRCQGKRLGQAALAVKLADLDIAQMSELSLNALQKLFAPYVSGQVKAKNPKHPEQILALSRIADDLCARLDILLDLGLGHLSLERSTPTLSPGELQRLRLATQVRSNLFGVVYVLDEPSAGLHPKDTQALLKTFKKLRDQGNTLFVVEHEIEIIKACDWIIDVGPLAGELGGEILYSGPLKGLNKVAQSQTKRFIYPEQSLLSLSNRKPCGQIHLSELNQNNIKDLSVDFPLGVLTVVTGISGSGKSTLVTQLLVNLMQVALGQEREELEEDHTDNNMFDLIDVSTSGSGKIAGDLHLIDKLIQVDQKSIGRTPRSNLATYTGLFDHVRKIFATTKLAKARKYSAARFSFNLKPGRCDHCQGEGQVMVELLFLPSVYSPCPVCQGARYNQKTLEVKYKNKNIADILNLTVDEAHSFFSGEKAIEKSLSVLQEVGLGYLRLGQPATELSGGEAQRIKLASELQRLSRGKNLYILDEPTTGLHPADVKRLMLQLNKLVDQGHSVIIVEHDMSVIAEADWVIDLGPGAGDEGGMIVAQGSVLELQHSKNSVTAKFLKDYIAERTDKS